LHPRFDLSVYLLLGTKSIEARGAEISNSLKYRRRKQPKIAEQSLAVDAGLPKIVQTFREGRAPRFREEREDLSIFWL